MGEQPDVAELVVEPLARERAEDRDPRGTGRDRRADGQLGVRLVLVRRRPIDRDAGLAEAFQLRGLDRVPVADPAVDPDPERSSVPRAAVGGDDDVDVVGPARPDAVEVRPRPHPSISEHERVTAHRVAGPDRAAR